jgi:dienelactone hydrolase
MAKDLRLMTRISLLVAFVLQMLAVSALGSSAFGRPGDVSGPGPWTAARTTVTVVRANGSTFAAEVHYPAVDAAPGSAVDRTGGPHPIAAFGHGFLCPVDRYRSTGAHLASWGLVTILPTTQGGLLPSHQALADDLNASLDWLTAEGGRKDSFWAAAIDGSERGLLGHSMGGGAALLAAAGDARTAAVAVLAAADTNPSSIAAAGNVRCATRLIVGDDDTIVPPSSTSGMYDNLAGPKQDVTILGGFHCGFIDSSILFCDSGAISRDAQLAIVGRELAEFLLLYLRDDAARWNEVWGDGAVEPDVTQRESQTPDLDGNGVVDGGDLGLLVANWDQPGRGDLNGDGIVTGADLGLLIAAWK